MEKTIRQLMPPSQRVLCYDPIKYVLFNKKIKLQLTEQTFLFVLSETQPNILYFIAKGKICRLNKLLQIFTNEVCIQNQFRKLLQKPILIQNIEITIIVLECIYIFSDIFNIDLTSYIKNNSLDNLINYYFKSNKSTEV